MGVVEADDAIAIRNIGIACTTVDSMRVDRMKKRRSGSPSGKREKP